MHHLLTRIVDLLAVIAAFGCIVSSGITLVVSTLIQCLMNESSFVNDRIQIFFPRSIEGEIAAKDASRERKRTKSSGFNSMLENRTGNRSRYSQSIVGSSNGPSGGTYLLTSSPVKQHYSLPSHDGHEYESNTPGQPMSPLSDTAPKSWAEEELDMPASLPKSALMRPNRRINGDVELGGIGTLSETNLSRHNGMQSNVHSAIHNFTSPIGVYLYQILFRLSNHQPDTRHGIWRVRGASYKCFSIDLQSPLTRLHKQDRYSL